MVENKNYDGTVPNISIETIIEASLEEVWESVEDIQSHVNWMDDAWVNPILPTQGRYSAPERPGHGLEFKKEFISDYILK